MLSLFVSLSDTVTTANLMGVTH